VFNTVKPEPVSFTLVLENNPTLLTKRGKKKTIILCFSHVTAKITDPISKNPAKPNSQAHLLAFSSPLIYHNYMTQKLRKCQHFCTKDLSTAHSQIPTHYHHGNLPPPKDKYPSSAAQA
jgi:hypothetical protein